MCSRPLPETTHVVVLGAGLDGDQPGSLLTRRLERALVRWAPEAL
ncbi:hypothetical protein [Streptomyces tibetensis]